MAQLEDKVTIVIDVSDVRRKLRKILALAREANSEIAALEEAIAIRETEIDAIKTRAAEYGIRTIKEKTT